METERVQWLCGQVKEYGTTSKQHGSIIPSKSLYWSCGGRCHVLIHYCSSNAGNKKGKKKKKRKKERNVTVRLWKFALSHTQTLFLF